MSVGKAIYALLEGPEDRDRWSAAFLDSPAYHINVAHRLEALPTDGQEAPPTIAEPQAATAATQAGLPRQLFWLTLRYAEVLRRDIPNLALLLVQAPAIALALLIIFHRDIFAATAADGGDALRGVMALHMMTASAIWLGASNAAREITKEAAIYARERLVNLNVFPYIMSKVVVF